MLMLFYDRRINFAYILELLLDKKNGQYKFKRVPQFSNNILDISANVNSYIENDSIFVGK